MRKPQIRKTLEGFAVDNSEIFRFEMHYDKNGVYKGQYQTNVLDDGPDLFFPAEIINGVPCVNETPVPNLTIAEMEQAQ